MTQGHEALAAELRSTPPEGLAALTDTHARELADLLRQAREAQKVELDAAIDEGLNVLPRPLRGTVRKVMGL